MSLQDFLSFANMVTIAGACFFLGRFDNRLANLEKWREDLKNSYANTVLKKN